MSNFYMAKQHKYNLVLEADYDYDLIGICSHHSDYRLVWGINELLKLKLAKADDTFVVTSKKGISSRHAYYFQADEENMMDFYLIKNKSEGKFLIQEKQQVDYFFFLLNNRTIDLDEWLSKIKGHTSVLAAFVFDPASFSSTESIVF